ncbi:MAG TPA: hypothetical protein VEZ71_29035 [Archangium sp.]|nr:hypothetical protein [Archangium sp.]
MLFPGFQARTLAHRPGEFSNESVHEKLHALAGLLELQSFPENPIQDMEPQQPMTPGS